MVFGLFTVLSFFISVHYLTLKWKYLPTLKFAERLFLFAVITKVLYVVFIYYFYIETTGTPFGYSDADAVNYDRLARYGAACLNNGHFNLFHQLHIQTHYRWGSSDMGYPIYLSILYAIFDNSLLVPRLLKALMSACMCVLIYKLASRNFGVRIGKMAGIMAMLTPNFFYYCGINLKETEMVFLVVLFLERMDYLIRNRTFTLINILLPVVCIGFLFFFRTVLAMTALFSFISALMISSNRIMHWSRRLVLFVWLLIASFFIVGGQVFSEVEEYWERRTTNQQESLKFRSEREGGNKLATYASDVVFVPTITIIPLPTMVDITHQPVQQMRNGDYYIKNILSFFVWLAFFFIFKEQKWRKHILIGSFFVGYLLIIALSGFAHSERFHLPALPCYIIIASYGISKLRRRHIRYFTMYLFLLFVVIMAWNWFKLAGRGMA
jgi:hypothetical protein